MEETGKEKGYQSAQHHSSQFFAPTIYLNSEALFLFEVGIDDVKTKVG